MLRVPALSIYALIAIIAAAGWFFPSLGATGSGDTDIIVAGMVEPEAIAGRSSYPPASFGLASSRGAARNRQAPASSAAYNSATAPGFGPITFAREVTDDWEIIGQGTSFPSGTTDVWAVFKYSGMSAGTEWRREWRLDGKLIIEVDEIWEDDDDEAGELAYAITDETGLDGGAYTITLLIDGQQVQQASFTVGDRLASTVQRMQQATFEPIIFCQNVDADTQCLKPSVKFTAGITEVSAIVTYHDMVSGQKWRRLWEKDGQTLIDKPDQSWDQGANGRRTFSLKDEDGLDPGKYTFTLFVGDRRVQSATFEVATGAPPASAAFGPVIFSFDIDREKTPIGPGVKFEFGAKEIYAIFPYLKMKTGQKWSREWLRDGRTLDKWEGIWDGKEEGTTYLFLRTNDNKPLPAGAYTLNLSLEGKVVRSGNFSIAVQPTPAPPARPEDVVDSKLLPYWRKLAGIKNPTVQEIAQLALKYRIPIGVEDRSGNFDAVYTFSTKLCNTRPGKVSVMKKALSNSSADGLTALIAHELTHAAQALEWNKPCRCTIDSEFWAYVVQIYVLQELGHKDWLANSFGGIYDANGKFSEARLYSWIRKNYECPEN